MPKGLLNRDDRLDFLTKQILEGNKITAMKVAEAQGRFEGATVLFESLSTDGAKLSTKELRNEQRANITLAAIECHFMLHHPLSDDWFRTKAAKAALKQVKRIKLVQGRYDIVCPPRGAFELAQAHPHMDMAILPLAGHASSELAMTAALVKAANELKAL